ncbi:MAG: acylphosphatase [Gammaproteobacteria bacterium]
MRAYVVSGRVQGVWYRASARERAAELGLRGWVRNLADGRVEALAAGTPAALAAFEAWLAEGPPRARVSGVDMHVVESPGPTLPAGFEVR